MNTKRIIFWSGFLIILALIIWGMAVAMKKQPNLTPKLGAPAAISATDHVLGTSTAPVTLIEYSDFQCPACETYFSVIEKVLASSTVPIRLVYRHFPLPQHANALAASMASEAAGVQGKFWDMYRLIFANHTDWTEVSDPTDVFVGYARDLGLNVAKFQADLSSSTLKDHISADKSEGYGLGINSTPTFFVNGVAISNPQSYDEFQALIQAAAGGRSR